MLTLFCGYDYREAIGYHVFTNSVLRHSTVPISFVPLSSYGLSEGTNAFTLSRFLIPFLTRYNGKVIFADASDMLMLGDIADLLPELDNLKSPVAVVKHNYKTRNPRKYIGTPMEADNIDYPKKNWASFMLINAAHPYWKIATPQKIEEMPKKYWLEFQFLPESEVVEINSKWNRLVDEGQPANGAKILHWTAGIPYFPFYDQAPCADLWKKELQILLGQSPYT